MKKKLSGGNQLLKRSGEESSERMEAYRRMPEVIEGEEDPGKKYEEQIALSPPTAQRCEWCIASSGEDALEANATEEEILEVRGVAVMVGGAPVLMNANLIPDSLEGFSGR